MAESKSMRQQMEEYIRNLQNQIVTSLERLDPNASSFKRDSWIRPEGGLGQSCIFAVPPDGDESNPETVLEKAGVNISIVHGTLPPAAVNQMRADHNSIPLPENPTGGLPFFAAGLSLVIHPRNPHAPTAHANYRYFEITELANTSEKDKDNNKVIAWWFGGGADLTPSYLYEDDTIHFHQAHKTACEQAGSPSLFPAFKKWCDQYFTITHRKETRGVGGIFFDDLNSGKHSRLPDDRARSPEEIFKLIKTLGDAFVPAYVPIVEKRALSTYTPHQRRWQLIRRGRYVEFNLIYDRGTRFGLNTPGARIESILMSLPEVARWEYMSDLGEDENSEEGKLVKVLRNPRDWV